MEKVLTEDERLEIVEEKIDEIRQILASMVKLLDQMEERNRNDGIS